MLASIYWSAPLFILKQEINNEIVLQLLLSAFVGIWAARSEACLTCGLSRADAMINGFYLILWLKYVVLANTLHEPSAPAVPTQARQYRYDDFNKHQLQQLCFLAKKTIS